MSDEQVDQMSTPTGYTEYHPRWYRKQPSTLWWLRRRSYLLFILRELSSVFVAWSVVFLLLAVEELGETSAVAPALAAITFTVLASVVLHGVSAGPLVSRYAVSEAATEEPANGPRSRRGAHE